MATNEHDYTATPYDSGYSHGCSDAKISNLSERYINQPGKGLSFHTFSFMQGYYNGYSACSASSPPAMAQQEQHTWAYNQGPVAFMSGYAKGIGLYWFNRGVVEGNNKLPLSSHNANYTKGYNDATYDLPNVGHLGSLPAHTSDNYGDFLSGT